MNQIEQTKLSEFEESNEKTSSHHMMFKEVHLGNTSSSIPESSRARIRIWHKTLGTRADWGVCNFDETIILVQLLNGRIYAHGEEAVCKWCGGILEIQEDRVFCTGTCKRYQGEFSRDLNAFLWWEGVKSYTLRKVVAETEHLELESRDLEPISYAPDWSVLYEYEDEIYTNDISKE